MIILCDVDGVVADLHTEWIRRYNADYGDVLTPDSIRSWNVADHVKPECGKRIYDYLRATDLYANVPEVKGASWGVAALRGAGHRVVFVTSNGRGMVDQKWEWLERRGFLPKGSPLAPDLISATDKSLFVADAMIDDYHENLRGSLVRHKVLFTRPWNAGERGPWARVRSWFDIVVHPTFGSLWT